MPRARTTVFSLAVVLSLGACSDGDDASPTEPTSASEVSTTEPGTRSNGDPTSSATPTSAAPETTAPPSTTSTTSTTTTVPPTPRLTLAATPLESGRPRAIAEATDLAVIGAGERAVVSGGSTPAPGEATRATIWWTDDGGDPEAVLLDQADAAESIAWGVGGSGDVAVAGGSITGPDGTTPAVWRSIDGAQTWGPAETPYDGPGLISAVAATPERAVLAGWRATEASYELVVASEDPDGAWSVVALPVTGIDPVIDGIVVDGDRVVVTGAVRRAGRSTGQVWWSGDGGATFTESTDEVVLSATSFGPPIVGLDGIVATTSVTNGPTALVTTADGVTWRSVPLALAQADGPAGPANNGGAHAIAPFDGGFAVGITSVISSVAEVDAAGSGSFDFAPYTTTDVFFTPRPFVIGGVLHALGESATGFAIAERQPTGWIVEGRSGSVPGRPADSSVGLHPSRDGVLARAVVFPDVERSANGGISWGSDETWKRLTPDGTEPFSTPDQTVEIVTTGGVDVATGSLDDDPEDGDVGGPSGGSWVATRSDDAWSDRATFLTGPGGENVYDLTAFGTGAIAVGEQAIRNADGTSTSAVIIREATAEMLADGSADWTTPSVEAELGDRAWLERVVVAADGSLVVATGDVFENDAWRPLVLVRGDGTWQRAVLPTDADDASLWAVAALSDGVLLATREAETWFTYRSTDGTTWERAPLDLDDAGRARPRYVVALDDVTLVVGTTTSMAVDTLAAWRLDDAGATTPIEVDDAPTSGSLRLSDVDVTDGVLRVGGVIDDRNVVWTVDATDLGS